ncbi:MAG: hypothetical protein EBT15_11770 [Betaproteobacteria bacterium]|nr:hypothetical protein [Betaproteobacteria bacterium]
MSQSIHPLGDTTYHFVKANVLNSLQDKEIAALKDRIQRLEKAGEDLAVCGYFMGFVDELKAWRKAKGTL